MEVSMVLDFQYSKEEFVKSRRKYLLMSKAILLQLVIIPIAFFVYIIFLCMKGLTIFTASIGIVFLFDIYLIFMVYIVQPGRFYERTEKFHEEYHMEFLEDKIVFHTEGIHSELLWNIFSALWENKKYYYLIQSRGSYSVIPKRVFSSKEQRKEFKELFRSKNPSANYKYFE
jgi:hypothetical protein